MTDKKSQAHTMLVRSENLDELLTVAGEVIIASSSLERAQKSLQEFFEADKPINSETIDVTKDLVTMTSAISSRLHKLVQDIRTVDLKDMSFRARRLVRDISRKTGKLVDFQVEGEDIQVDKSIVEKLYDPIAHQLRNSVDHGIEDTLTRQRNGKSEEGHIRLNMYNSENETFIEIEDDGAGVDLKALRQKAIEAGKIDDTVPMSEELALELMCTPGITTKAALSEVSGRGVGMDVVRNHINHLGGSVSFETSYGKGSKFTFRVPLVSAVNIVDALLVRAEDFYFAFPILSVVATMSIAAKDVQTSVGKDRMVKYLGNLLPLHDLCSLVDARVSASQTETIPVLVIDHKGQRVALAVSEFFSPQKLVIIPFDKGMEVDGLVGSTILGSRRLGFIIDVPGLMRLAFNSGDMAAGADAGEERKEEGAELEAFSKAADLDVSQDRQEVAGVTVEPESGSKELIIEIEKMIPSLNESIFAIESDSGNMEEINRAFRLFHTIKGNFMMNAFNEGCRTIHCVESLLDRARSGKLEVQPEVIDILMDGVAFIEDVVKGAKVGQWQDQPQEKLIAAAEKLLPKKKEIKNKAVDFETDQVRLSDEGKYRANNYRRQKIPFYQCFLEFDSGRQPAFLFACIIFKRFLEFGDVLGSLPTIEEIEAGRCSGKIKLLFVSEHNAEKLEKELPKFFKKYYNVSNFILNRFV